MSVRLGEILIKESLITQDQLRRRSNFSAPMAASWEAA